jgi:hypothetical protein
MSNFRPINRNTGFLLPPSVDEWLPLRHLARFVVKVIDGLDLSELEKSYRGSKVARVMGMLQLGTVALDGTKVHANASRHTALSYVRACRQDREEAQEGSAAVVAAGRTMEIR